MYKRQHLERTGLLCCGTGAERDDSVLHTQSLLAYSVVGLGQREMIVFYTPREDWLTLLRDWGRER